MVNKVDIQGGTDNTVLFTHNHPYISSCKLQLSEVSSAVTYVGIVTCDWCCVIIATLYMYFVDQCHPQLHFLASMKSFLYYNRILCTYVDILPSTTESFCNELISVLNKKIMQLGGDEFIIIIYTCMVSINNDTSVSNVL